LFVITHQLRHLIYLSEPVSWCFLATMAHFITCLLRLCTKSGVSVMAKTKKSNSNNQTTEGRKLAATKHVKTSIAHEQTEVIMDRRGKERRKASDRRNESVPVVAERRTLERRVKVNRRRQIDPTTCERDYTDDEVQFMSALEQYKRTSGRMFPTCSEVLEVLRGLGYEKRPAMPEPSLGIPVSIAELAPVTADLAGLPAATAPISAF
jgi:hypothetical protein